MAVMVINNIGKWLYRVYMYKPLFVNVSVSLIVSGVQPHMTACSEIFLVSVLFPLQGGVKITILVGE